MDRLYTVLAGLLLLGGVGALIGQAWALGAILLALGALLMAAEFHSGRTKGRIVLNGGPDAHLEAIKAQGVQNMQLGPNHDMGYGGH